MCFQGCEYRERLLAIDFLVFYYFLREQRLMENFSFPSNSVHSSLLTPFNLSLFAIPMCTLTNLGMMFLLSLIPFFTVCWALFFGMPSCSGGMFLWESSCLECSHSFTISWRYALFPEYLIFM